LADLAAAQDALSERAYQGLTDGFQRYLDYAASWRQIHATFIRYKMLEASRRPDHHELLSVELQHLLDLARDLEARRGPNTWPANPAHLRRFANEIREVANYFEKQQLRQPGVELDISLFVPR